MITSVQRITLCGMGGQGMILAAVVLGTAATYSDKYAVQTQSYGSEARGGQCQAELIIDDKPIGAPTAEEKDLILAMFQEAYDRYHTTLAPEGVLVYDPDLVPDVVPRSTGRTISVPATQIAVDLGNRMAANMVMLGFLSEALGVVDMDALLKAAHACVPERFLALNIKAIEAGAAFAHTIPNA